MLFCGTFFQFGEFRGIDVFRGSGDAAGFRGVILGADGFRQDRTDHAFNTGTIVVGDPARDFEQGRRDEGFGIDERVDFPHRELALGRRLKNCEYCARRGFLADRHTHPAALDDR